MLRETEKKKSARGSTAYMLEFSFVSPGCWTHAQECIYNTQKSMKINKFDPKHTHKKGCLNSPRVEENGKCKNIFSIKLSKKIPNTRWTTREVTL